MGDLSNEPSMEDILSSIKRIIAEEGDAAPRIRRAGRPAPAAEPEPDDAAILELSDPIPSDRTAADRLLAPERSRAGRAAAAERDRDDIPPRPEPTVRSAPSPAQSTTAQSPAAQSPAAHSPAAQALAAQAPAAEPRPSPSRPAVPPEAAAPAVSPDTVEATRGALDQLSRMLVRPEPGSDGTLEGLVREMVRPMLRDWLDSHLPALVKDMVAREIGKITGSQR